MKTCALGSGGPTELLLLLWVAMLSARTVGIGMGAEPGGSLPVGNYVPTWPKRLAVSGQYAYLADSSAGLQVFDISDPGRLRWLGGYDTRGTANDVVVSGPYAFVADGSAGLLVVDLSHPARPRPVGDYDTSGAASGVAVSGDYAYVADGQTGLQVIDVSDPAMPRRVGGYATTGEAVGVAVSGDYAYVVLTRGMVVVDVSSAANPRGIGACDIPGSPLPAHLVVSGNHAYVAASGVCTVIDISTPADPRPVGGEDPLGLRRAGPATDISVSGSHAHVTVGYETLEVFDISRPANPRRLGACGSLGGPSVLAVSGGIAYLSSIAVDMQAIDLSDPIQPRRFGGHDTPGTAHDVAVSGHHAYIADGLAGLQVVDVSDAVRPRRIGGYDTSGDARAVVVSGPIAYLADATGGLQVFDISQPDNPRRVGGYVPGGHVFDLVVSGGRAYLAHDIEGLKLIDVRDPASPRLVGSWRTQGWVRSVAVSGGHVLAGDRNRLQVIDVSDPANPRLVAGYDTNGDPTDVVTMGGYAFVTSDRLQILDLTEPFRLRRVGEVAFCSGGLAVSDTEVYVSNSTGLTVVDVSNPANPRALARYGAGRGNRVAVSGDYAYVANGEAGIQIVPVRERPVSLTTQPQAQRAVVGGTVTLAVVAEGTPPLVYQWRKDAVDLPGATSPSLTLTNVQYGDAGTYTVVVGGTFGPVTSQPAELTVFPTVVELTPLGTWPGHSRGAARKVVHSGRYAYVLGAASDGSSLHVIDVLDPAQPQVVGGIGASASLGGLAVSGHHAYITGGDSGLQVIDVSDPSRPVRAGRVDTKGQAWDVAVSGSHAYVTVYYTGLRILDLSDPRAPRQVGSYETSDDTLSVAASGRYVYMAGNGLQVIDVSDPSHPRKVGRLNTPYLSALGLDVSGSTVYLADSNYGLRVIDVSDAANPRLVGGYNDVGHSAHEVAVLGRYAYLADGSQGVLVIDISTPSNPQRVGQWGTRGDAQSVVVMGDHVGVTDSRVGLWLLDLGDPIHPRPSGGCSTTGSAVGVVVAGSTAYLADGDAGLQMVDVSDPNHLRGLGRYDTEGAVEGVAVSDGRAYLSVAENSSLTDGLQVVDVSDAARPKGVGGHRLGGRGASSVAVSSPYAYVIGGDAMLYVVDVSDPVHPARKGEFKPSEATYRGGGISADGNLIHVARGSLQILDVADATHPRLVGSHGTSGGAGDVAISEGTAYVADGDYWLQVIDVSRPGDPRRLGGYAMSKGSRLARGIAVSGTYAFLAITRDGLQVIDAGFPEQPLEVASDPVGDGEAQDVTVVDDRVYVAAGTAGLHVFRFRAGPRILTQPPPRTAYEGDEVTFAVRASGTEPLRYEWRKDGLILAGATSSTLMLGPVSLADAGRYTVAVSNALHRVSSLPAALTVLPGVRFVTNAVTVSRLAGRGIPGDTDGPAGEAMFRSPNGGIADSEGNGYVADTDNHRIRKVNSQGTVTTVAGSGVAGYADGAAASSQFSFPLGACVDGAGNVFVADTGNNRIRRIDRSGVVSTVAGSGVAGRIDGPGASARFDFPNDLALDRTGNLYVSEFGNHTVRKITPDGTVSTWVGDGTAGYADGPRASARLNQPGGITIDGVGRLYLTEWGGQRIRQVSTSGVVTTLAGDGVAGYRDGEASAARFRNPDGIGVDAEGNVFVTDHGNHAIRWITPAGQVGTVAGTGEAGSADGPGPEARFRHPGGVGVVAPGLLSVADGGNHLLRRIRISGLEAAPQEVVVADESRLQSALDRGGVVRLAFDGTLGLTRTLTLERDVEIDGTGHQVILSGNQRVRVLEVRTNVQVTLRHLTVADGRGEQGGGLLNDGGTVSLVGCTFTNNRASGVAGTNGPVLPAGSDALGQPAIAGGAGTPGLGGAIFTTGSLVASNCLLVANRADGGAGGAGGLIPSIKTNSFGSATYLGGIQGPGGEGGWAGGGAVYQESGLARWVACTFTNNLALGGTGGAAPTGAVVNGTGGPGGGGGQALGGAVAAGGGRLEWVGCVARGNAAEGGAGGMVNVLQLASRESWLRPDVISRAGPGGPGAIARGGAVYSRAEGFIQGSWFHANRATGGAGGRGGSFPPQVLVTGALGAVAGAGGPGGDGEGGGLWSLSPFSAEADAWTENRAVGGTGGPGGGGIPAPIPHSGFPVYFPVTASGAEGGTGGHGRGGAWLNRGDAQTLNLTVAGNVARGGTGGEGGRCDIGSGYAVPGGSGGAGGTGFGGGLFNETGVLQIRHASVVANTADRGAGGTGGLWLDSNRQTRTGPTGAAGALPLGGGIRVAGGTVKVVNTIVADSPEGGNLSGAILDGGHNLSSDASVALVAPGSRYDVNLQLGSAGDQGGPTPSVALLGGSPALDAADPAACPPTDQRGYPRPLGPGCDVGAVEMESLRAPEVTLTTVAGAVGEVVTVEWVIRNANSGSALHALAGRVQLPPGLSRVEGTLQCSIPRLNPGEVFRAPLQVRVTALGNHLIHAQVTCEETGPRTLVGVARVQGRGSPEILTTWGWWQADDRAVLEALVLPNDSFASAWFRLGPALEMESTAEVIPTNAETGPRIFRVTLPAASPSGGWHYQLVVSNTVGVVEGPIRVLPRPVLLGVCSAASLRAALARGGYLRFECDGMIELDQPLKVSGNTVLDAGGHDVTLSGQDSARVLEVGSGAELTLLGIRIVHGMSSERGGALAATNGVVRLRQCVLQANRAVRAPVRSDGAVVPEATGGALYIQGGMLDVVGTRFEDNAALWEPLTATESISLSRGSASGGAVGAVDATVFLAGCDLIRNQARGGDGYSYPLSTRGGSGGEGGKSSGGGLALRGGRAWIVESMFRENLASGGEGGRSATMYPVPQGDGTGGNGGVAEGGAVHASGTLELHASLVAGNLASGGNGGAGMGSSGSGISRWLWPGGSGGDARGGGVYAFRDLHLVNTTFASNRIAAGSNGTNSGGAYRPGNPFFSGAALHQQAGLASVLHGTWSQNLAPSNRPPQVLAGLVWLANNLVDGPSTEALCAATVTDLGGNLARETPSPWFTAIDSRTGTDPRLLPLANHGGPTWTMALAPGSPAIDAGRTGLGTDIDARGIPRPQGRAADVGAYEFESGIAPTITVEPADQTVRAGETATFSVAATGSAPLDFRWLRQTPTPDQPWTWVANATGPALLVSNVQFAATGAYRAVVSNAWGAVTSRVAVLSLRDMVRPVTNLVIVGTLAGTGVSGYRDGSGGAAQFNAPNGGFVDEQGNAWIADTGNHRIRKITPDGLVTTVAGTGVAGFADGPAATSQFSSPLGVCADREGHVYVADAGNHRIRRIAPTGHVSTVAGTGVAGYRDGPGTVAEWNVPNDLAFDASGNLLVTEFANHTVRRIAPDGTASTWLGDGQAGSADGPRHVARLNQPGGIALDRDGVVYVTEYGGHRVRRVSVSGVVSTLAGDGTPGYLDGEGGSARFRHPDGIVVGASGEVYVADNGNHALRRISPSGLVETVVGAGRAGGTDGSGTDVSLANPTGVGWDARGILYVTEAGAHRVRWMVIVVDRRPVVITRQPADQEVLERDTVTLSASAEGSPPIQYQWRQDGVDLPGRTGASLVLERVRLDQGGSYLVVASNPVNVVTSRVAVLRVTPSVHYVGAAVTVTSWAGAGVAGSADGPGSFARFDGPQGLHVEAAGQVWVADRNNHRIRRIAPDGTVSTVAGSGLAGFADGLADQARFLDPRGVAVDRAGIAYVADAGNHRIRKIDEHGNVSTLAGTGVAGYRDGPGATAWFNLPNALVADATGTLFVTEFGNHTVRRIAPDGTASTWVGDGQPGATDGARNEARLNQPGGIAVDPEGNLYVTEYGGHRVRKVSAAGMVSTIAGDGTAGYLDGEGAAARFRDPGGIAVGALGYLYVADGGNRVIRRISPTGDVETVAGTGEPGDSEGGGTEAQFTEPTGIGVAGNGVLFVTDRGSQRVVKLEPPGLRVERQGRTLIVDWLGPGRLLQMATTPGPGAVWWDVPGGTNGPFTLPIADGSPCFYRLRDASTRSEPLLDPERWVVIGPGTFLMGNPATEPGSDMYARPQTLVTLARGFWMGRYEVTQREYQAVMGTHPSYFPGDPDRPVETVSWAEAAGYGKRRTATERAAGRLPPGYEYRLPTEAEWEYACRAGTTTATAFGESLGATQANFNGNFPYSGAPKGPFLAASTRVGSYPPNAWGLHDMHGNVSEWCQDAFIQFLPGGNVTDPRWKNPSSSSRTLRGGGWSSEGVQCRSAQRSLEDLSVSRSNDLGFRIVLAPLY